MKDNEDNKNNSVLNPFSPHHPSPPELFANREDILSLFRREMVNSSKLRPPAPTNFLILGDWGIGKTSLLYKFQSISLSELKDVCNILSVRLSLDPYICEEWNKFCSILLTRIKNNAIITEKVSEKIKGELNRWNIKVSIPFLSLERDKEGNGSASLIDNLESLWKEHLQKSDIDVAIICLDDVQYFLTADQEGAYLALRSTFQELARRGCNYLLILTSSITFWDSLAELAEPFSRFFKPIFLEPFNITETAEILRIRLDYYDIDLQIEKEVIQDIFKTTLGHPYFIIFIMSEIMNNINLNNPLTFDIYKELLPKINESLEKEVLENRLKIASNTEKDVLYQIASLEKTEISPRDIKKIRGVSMHFSRLVQKGLLKKKKRGLYEIFHPIFREFLKRDK